MYHHSNRDRDYNDGIQGVESVSMKSTQVTHGLSRLTYQLEDQKCVICGEEVLLLNFSRGHTCGFPIGKMITIFTGLQVEQCFQHARIGLFMEQVSIPFTRGFLSRCQGQWERRCTHRVTAPSPTSPSTESHHDRILQVYGRSYYRQFLYNSRQFKPLATDDTSNRSCARGRLSIPWRTSA